MKKVTASGSLSDPTSRPLFRGAERTRPEELLDASAATNLTCGAQGCGFDSLRGHFYFAFKSCDNEEKLFCAHSVSVASNPCKLGQNYSDFNHVQCGSLLGLNVYCPFTFRNIATWFAV